MKDDGRVVAVTWLLSIAALILAVAPILLPDQVAHTYRADVAVLAATLVAVIWYTRYTYASLVQARELADEERRSLRKSLASALLSELKRLEAGLRQIHANGSRGHVAWHRPVVDTAFRQLALFSPATSQYLADFSSLHEDVRFGLAIGRENGMNGNQDYERSLRTRAAFAIEVIPRLVEALERDGGEMPPRRPDPAAEEVPDLQESPFGPFDPARGWQ